MLVKALIERRSRIAKSAWIELIEKTNLKNASAIHATSTLEAEEMRRFKWRLPPIEIIPNGIDEIAKFADGGVSADVAEISEQQPFILFLGRISWKKGLDRLLSAFALTNLPKLAIVGPDDENIVPRLTQLARDLKIADRVRFLPRTVLGADKESLYASAQLFVLPSYSENFGNTVLEAIQRGLPVIVTPEVGAAKIVLEAKAGLVVPGDPQPLSSAIRHLIETVPLARAMGESGRRHVGEHYSWACIAEEMENLYTSLTRGEGRAFRG
jgi:glycosyltransferase involved in cell wall biosynthesis